MIITNNFQNRNYLIVGASSGIGLEIVTQLIEFGANLYTISRNELPIEIASKVKQHYYIDITTDFEIPNIPEVIDGLVYCPGNINLKPFIRLKPSDFVNDFNLNLVGAVKVLGQSINSLLKSDNASVVMFSSIAASVGMNFHSVTASVKSAIEGFTKSMAAEYAPKIRFNTISPTLTDTNLAKTLLNSEDKRKNMAERNPMKRVGTPADIARMTLFLLSGESTYITGQIISVDGGARNIK